MKLKDVNKLYESMEPRALAIMAFESLVKQDLANANAITSSVPRYNYNAVDMNYRDGINHMFQIASLWSVEYWKCYAFKLGSIGASLCLDASKEVDKLNRADESQYLWEQKLKALGMMLDELKNTYGLNTEILPQYAGAIKVIGLGESPESLSDQARLFYDNYLQFFESIINVTEVCSDVEAYFAVEPFSEITTH